MRRTIINLGSVFSGEVLLRGATFLVAVVIARRYGPALLGIYAIALAYSSIAATVADNGLMVSAVVEISSSPDDGSRILTRVYSAKALLFFPMLLVLGAAALLAHLSVTGWLIGALLTVRAMLQAFCQVNIGVLKSIDRMPMIAVSQGLNFIGLVSSTISVYVFHWNIFVILGAMVVSQCLEWICSTLYLSQNGVRLLGFSVSGVWSLVRHATPMGITYTLASIILRVDVVVASALFATVEVGRFASAHMLLVMCYLSSWLFSSVMLPELVRIAADANRLNEFVRDRISLIAKVCMPFALVLSIIARRWFTAIYGDSFASAGILASIMFLAIPFIVMNSFQLSREIALRNARIYVTLYSFAGVGSVIVGLLMARLFGLNGLAGAIVLREIGLFSAFWALRIRPERQINRAVPVAEI